ncbi:hypothetical protein IW492_12565 [Enterococcus sp. BWB1-3]|uniref:hypothetical protein n=1 Tax=Enterococcus sp. BWB1-3 TaxID=2787713 RepID=UPI00192412B9|nr:hypothetical protein [Enterococcus sp. BWB1-3]MBL1230066.1 hypothetical protein [Enterococcus sp. BWB1-3]
MNKIKKILIDNKLYNQIIDNCQNDLIENERDDHQSFGIIVGKINGVQAEVIQHFPLKRNYRLNSNISQCYTQKLCELGYPGELQIERRGWVSDPIELIEVIKSCNELNLEFIGGYHMHHDESWSGPEDKRIPSKLDKELVKNSGEMVFVVSILKKERAIRCFYEGNEEIKIVRRS